MDSCADVQIWDNAAFDNGVELPEDLSMDGHSWVSQKSVFGNAKENQGLALESKISSVSSLKLPCSPFNPLDVYVSVEKSRIESKGFEEIAVWKSGNVKEIRNGKKIDEEIEEIESQIERLNSRLEALRREKADRRVKVMGKRAKVVPAKFMGPNQSVKNAERRGMSLGPWEIFSAVKSGKQEMITPTPLQSRRKSCMLKADVTSRQAVTTIASRKSVKREDELVANSVQPKNLFRDGEKSANKKPLRYNNQNASEARLGQTRGDERGGRFLVRLLFMAVFLLYQIFFQELGLLTVPGTLARQKGWWGGNLSLRKKEKSLFANNYFAKVEDEESRM